MDKNEDDFSATPDVPLIPRRALFGNPVRTATNLSPDGQTLSWLAPHGEVMNIWVAPRERMDEAHVVTHDTYRGIGGYAWAFDGRHLLYHQDGNGDENWHLHAVAIDTGEVRDLTPFAGARGVMAGLSRRRRGEVLVAINQRDPRHADLFSIDIATGAATLVIENPGFAGFITDDHFRVHLGVRPHPDGASELVRLGAEGQWSSLLRFSADDARASGPLQLDVSGRVLFLLDNRDRDTTALKALDLASGELSVLAEHAGADIGNVMFDNNTYRPTACSVTVARRELIVLDEAVRADLDLLEASLPGDWGVASRSEDDRWWVVGAASDRSAGAAWLFDRGQRTLRKLHDTQPALSAAPLARMVCTTIPARDGLPLLSYLTIPVGSDDGSPRPLAPLPLVLLVHGGPWVRDAPGFNTLHQWLANRGYGVLSVNFRGSSGLGKRFIAAGDREWGARMDDDLCDAVQWAVDAGVADPARVAIMGGSYGGYAVLAALTLHPGKYVCGVDIVGPSNLETLMGAIPPYWESERERLYRAVGDPRTPEGLALLRERSPLHRADRIRDPLLIGQGANDPRVHQSESDQMVAALREGGIPVTYALFPDEGHGFARPANSMAFNTCVEAFLAHHLGGRAEPADPKETEGSTMQLSSGD